jgi:membrane-anchored protein YejM (alkaline phosphatase superfamily)
VYFLALGALGIYRHIRYSPDITTDLDTAAQFSRYNDIYEKFKSSVEKKLSVFIIILDGLPYTLISNGSSIKDDFPNLKSFSEKSLSFSRAFTNYDLTGKAISTILTGRFSKLRELNRKRNIIADLNNSDYNVRFYKDPLSLMKYINPSNYYPQEVYTQKLVLLSIFNFITSLYSFKMLPTFFTFNIAQKESSKELIQGIDFGSLKDNRPFFYYIHALGTHCPYVYDRDGTIRSLGEKPDSYIFFNRNYSFKKWFPIPPSNYDIVPLVNKTHIDHLVFWDKVIGKLTDNIINTFGEDNVLIVLTADHGGGWRPPNLFRNLGFVTWDSVGVPLMIYCPSKVKPKVYEEPFPLLDLLPTLYDLIEMEYKKKEFEGISLFSKERDKPREMFAISKKRKHVLKNNAWVFQEKIKK